VRQALEMARAAGVPSLNINGTINQLEAELVDLVESMAIATNRRVKWVGGRISRAPNSERMATSRLGRRRNPKKRGSNRFSILSSAPSKQGSAYILHEPDALAHAHRLQDGILLHTQQKWCYAGTVAAADMDESLERVVSSSYVILLQTHSVLKHAWPLLAVYQAALADVPIVCVLVAGGGYDFSTVEHHLKHLNKKIDADSLEQMSSVLSEWSPPRDVGDLRTRLFNLIPPLISVVYDPSGTPNQFAATIRDIHDKQDLMQLRHRRRSTSTDHEDKLRRRGSHLVGLGPGPGQVELAKTVSGRQGSKLARSPTVELEKAETCRRASHLPGLIARQTTHLGLARRPSKAIEPTLSPVTLGAIGRTASEEALSA